MIRRRKHRANRPSPHELIPPEGVPINLRVAPIGSRFAAQLTDLVVTLVGALALVVLLSLMTVTGYNTVYALAALLFFFIRVPYYTLTELMWNGQTLGKRLMSVKVIAADGGPLTTHAIVARNLMKEAEIFLPGTLLFTLDTVTPVASLITFGWIFATLMVPLMNPRRQRFGDMMAGTYVIQQPVPILLPDVSQARTPIREGRTGYSFFAHQLDHYGVYELQTLEELLRASDRSAPGARGAAPATLAAIVERIRAKIGYPHAVPAPEHLDFLKAFYKAQRAHLEQRQLFGDRRADKFHARDTSKDETP